MSVTKAKTGRNEPCPCGSGLKYKKCHWGSRGFTKPFEQPEAAERRAPDPTNHTPANPMANRNSLDDKDGSGIGSYLTFSEIRAGRAFHPDNLRDSFRHFAWDKLLLKLATLASSMANDGAPDSYASQVDLALRRSRTFPRTHVLGKAAEFAANNPRRPLIHEQAIYFLQALAILEGVTDGRDPTELDLSMMFLMANDYLGRWKHSDSRELSGLERSVAELFHVARFNKHPDALRELVRPSFVFTQRPEQGPLVEDLLRHRLERAAYFGQEFSSYFTQIVAPLIFHSTQWGIKQKNGSFLGPTMKPAVWLSETAVPPDSAVRAISSLTMDRVVAQQQLSSFLHADGLPHHSPAAFVAAPFISIDDETVVAASPWMVREHLRGGLWMRMMKSAQAELGDAETWTRAFGQMFELACRELARESSSLPGFSAKVLLSKTIGGSDEVEDVVLTEGDAACLASAKSQLVRARVAREAESRSSVIEWYEEFLFALPRKGRRAGALRLLDQKVRLVRGGKADNVSATARVFPVLVTFDDLCETPALNNWIDERCRSENLFQDDETAPPLLLTLEGFESLLALIGNGLKLKTILDDKSTKQGRWFPFRHFASRYSPDGKLLRLPMLTERFNVIHRNVQSALFPGSREVVSSDSIDEAMSKMPGVS